MTDQVDGSKVLEVWNRWDAPHYLDIARQGYVSTGEESRWIVFYPLYPWLVRAASLVLRDELLAAFFVSGGRVRAVTFQRDGETFEIEEIPGDRHPDGAAHGSGCTTRHRCTACWWTTSARSCRATRRRSGRRTGSPVRRRRPAPPTPRGTGLPRS